MMDRRNKHNITKKSKISLIIIISVSIFLILFVPIPIKENFDGGSAFTLNSLTYKVVFWDVYENTKKQNNSSICRH